MNCRCLLSIFSSREMGNGEWEPGTWKKKGNRQTAANKSQTKNRNPEIGSRK
jgi:hypothetical protein